MKKGIRNLFLLSLLAMFTFILPMTTNAASFANGSYDIPYEIKEAGGSSTSIADGYFLKPAKVTIEDGNYYVQFSVKNAEWIKSVASSYGEASVVSSDEANDQKVLQLQVSAIDKPEDLSMHIVVPEDVAGMEYDNQHKAKVVFDTTSIPEATSDNDTEETSSEANHTDDETDPAVKPEDNPKTGDEAPIIIFALLFVGAGLFLLRKLALNKQGGM